MVTRKVTRRNSAVLLTNYCQLKKFSTSLIHMTTCSKLHIWGSTSSFASNHKPLTTELQLRPNQALIRVDSRLFLALLSKMILAFCVIEVVSPQTLYVGGVEYIKLNLCDHVFPEMCRKFPVSCKFSSLCRLYLVCNIRKLSLCNRRKRLMHALSHIYLLAISRKR